MNRFSTIFARTMAGPRATQEYAFGAAWTEAKLFRDTVLVSYNHPLKIAAVGATPEAERNWALAVNERFNTWWNKVQAAGAEGGDDVHEHVAASKAPRHACWVAFTDGATGLRCQWDKYIDLARTAPIVPEPITMEVEMTLTPEGVKFFGMDDPFEDIVETDSEGRMWRNGNLIRHEVPDPAPEADGELLARLSTDAQAWAREFMDRFDRYEIQRESDEGAVDEATMIAWFANAIEAGRSAGWTAGEREAMARQVRRATFGDAVQDRVPLVREVSILSDQDLKDRFPDKRENIDKLIPYALSRPGLRLAVDDEVFVRNILGSWLYLGKMSEVTSEPDAHLAASVAAEAMSAQMGPFTHGSGSAPFSDVPGQPDQYQLGYVEAINDVKAKIDEVHALWQSERTLSTLARPAEPIMTGSVNYDHPAFGGKQNPFHTPVEMELLRQGELKLRTELAYWAIYLNLPMSVISDDTVFDAMVHRVTAKILNPAFEQFATLVGIKSLSTDEILEELRALINGEQ